MIVGAIVVRLRPDGFIRGQSNDSRFNIAHNFVYFDVMECEKGDC